MKNRSRYTRIICALLLLGNFFTSTVSAHEIFYRTSSGYLQTVALRWNPKIVKKLDMAVYSYLDSGYTSNLNSAISSWNTKCGSYLYAYDASTYSSANIYYIVPTTTAWNNATGSSTAAGFTVLYDTNGATVNSYATANSSTKSIQSAIIYLNPSTWSGLSSTTKTTTLTHEMGHAVCIGHCDNPDYNQFTGNSVMKHKSTANSTPQDHDLNDIYDFYG